jgi:hypothetical protein
VRRDDRALVGLLRSRGFISRGWAGILVYNAGDMTLERLKVLQAREARIQLMLGDTDHI